MNQEEILTKFSTNFIRKEFRKRFVHEAMKKNQRLHTRICHEISLLFDEKFQGQKPSLLANDECLLLGWSLSITQMKWKEIQQKISPGGGGYLVIRSDATAFYAETEGYPPTIYGGNLDSKSQQLN